VTKKRERVSEKEKRPSEKEREEKPKRSSLFRFKWNYKRGIHCYFLQVNAFDSIIAAVMMAAVMFLSLGIMGAASDIDFSSADLLASISTDPRAGWYSKLAVYLFPPAALLTGNVCNFAKVLMQFGCLWTGIPVFSIIIRYNLMESKLCGHAWANFIAVLANFKHDGTKVCNRSLK
jgi:hypothetical protein